MLTEKNIPLQRAACGIYSSIVMCQMIHLLRFTFPVWVSESAWGGWLGHRFLCHSEWEESTVLTWGTETPLWNILKLTIIILFFKCIAYLPVLSYLAVFACFIIFAHLPLIPVDEANLDEVANKHRPKGRWNYIKKFIANPEERRASKETI